MNPRDPSPAAQVPQQAWLALAVGDERQHAGNSGYVDEPARHYSWDSTVPNHSRLRPGDLIVLWDKNWLIGASVIDQIVEGSDEKERFTCPECGSAGIKKRKSLSPAYRCHECSSEFPSPSVRLEQVKTWRTEHAARWTDLSGLLSGNELRALAEKPKSQLSLRPLRWVDFYEAVLTNVAGEPLLRTLGPPISLAPGEELRGGHRSVTTRARIGQRDFRARLLRQYGPVCAISGPCPEVALEAAHLYSYAAEGRHHEHGGVLLRRDIHRLFDLGLVIINPDTQKVDVDPSLLSFAEYGRLDSRAVAKPLTPKQLGWIRQHWATHRGLA